MDKVRAANKEQPKPNTYLTLKYKDFRQLYGRCLLITIPLVSQATTFSSCQYQFPRRNLSYFQQIEIYAFPAGILLSLLAYPLLFLNRRISTFLWLDFFGIILYIVTLCVEQAAGIGYFLSGSLMGCNWPATQGYIRELGGWEERRAFHIQNIPNVGLFFGLLINGLIYYFFTGEFKDHQDLIFKIIFSFSLITCVIRFFYIGCYYDNETPVYHMKRFEELRGKLLLQQIYQQEYVEQIEFQHIFNNEKLNEINRNFLALFNKNYVKRTLTAISLNITLWLTCLSSFYFTSNKAISLITIRKLSYYYNPQTLVWFQFPRFRLDYQVTINSISIILIELKNSLLISSVILTLANAFIWVLYSLYYFKNYKTFELQIVFHSLQLIVLVVYHLIHFSALQMYTFQLIPDKGWSFISNLQWIGVVLSIYASVSINTNDLFAVLYVIIPVLSFIQSIIICTLCKEITGMNEYQIQSLYSGNAQLLAE